MQATGAPTTLAGTPKLRVYKAGGTTESSDITPTVDFDSRTGLNLCSIDLTGDSGFYATGNDFTVVITAGTVNSVSVVGYVVAEFSILKRSPLRPATAGRTLVVDASGLADANVVKIGPTGSGTAQTARDVGASVLLSTGTGTGQLDFTSGVVKANLAQILGTALTETAGQIAAAFKKFFDKATPTGTINSIPDAVAGATGGLFIAGTNAATTVTTSLTTTFTGNLTGSVGSVTGAVGSVTGAVGSVTGNVGGNVTGSVGSLGATAKSDVNAEVLDVINVDTYAEPAQGTPAATTTLAAKLNFLYKSWRNKKDNDGTTTKFYNDDAVTVDHKRTVGESAGTVTEGEIASGP